MMVSCSLMQDQAALKKQYKDSNGLEIRRSFHKKYSTNKTDYDEWIIQNIPFLGKKCVLDIGCGNGKLWSKGRSWLKILREVILADRSEGMISEVRKEFQGYTNVKCIQADICNLPFPEESFDIVIANSMLYHINELDKAVIEVYRVLKPNGVFVSTTFSKNGLNAYINDAMIEMGLLDEPDRSSTKFTLEEGGGYLKNFFQSVELQNYEDFLEVTKADDLVQYIFSMTSMKNLHPSAREKMIDYFEKKKNNQGVVRIPKIYGMFIASKKS